jgi:uncharacterized membrane protein YqjE
MEQATAHLAEISTTSKHVVRRLLTIGENRLELLMVEVQEERERLLHAILCPWAWRCAPFLPESL